MSEKNNQFDILQEVLEELKEARERYDESRALIEILETKCRGLESVIDGRIATFSFTIPEINYLKSAVFRRLSELRQHALDAEPSDKDMLSDDGFAQLRSLIDEEREALSSIVKKLNFDS